MKAKIDENKVSLKPKKVKSRTRHESKSSSSISVTKKSPKKSIRRSKKVIKNNTDEILMKKFKYNPSESEEKRQRSLRNAVIVYDPKGLYEKLQFLQNDVVYSNFKNVLKKDSEFVKKNYFKLIKN